MADVMRYRRGPKVEIKIEKRSATDAVQIGDFVKYVSNEGVKTGASADSTSLLGVSMRASPTTDAAGTKLVLYQAGHGTVFEFTVPAKDTRAVGDCFVINNDAQQLLKKTVVNLNLTATNVVAVCVEANAVSSSSVVAQLLPSVLQVRAMPRG